MLPPAETAGPAEPDAAEAADDGSSCTAAVAGLGVSAAIGLAPTVVRAGLADEVALLYDVVEDASGGTMSSTRNS